MVTQVTVNVNFFLKSKIATALALHKNLKQIKITNWTPELPSNISTMVGI